MENNHLKTVKENPQVIPKGNTQEVSNWRSIFIATFSTYIVVVIVSAICVMWLTHNAIDKATAELTAKFESELTETRSYIHSNTSENVIFLKVLILNKKTDPKLAREIAKSIYKWSRVYDRDPDMMISLISVESNFNSKAVSKVGAEGLTQIMPFWYEIFKEPEGTFFQVDKSIEYSHKILALYEKQYGDIGMALTAYNRGHHRIETDLIRGNDPTNGYASKILDTYKKLKAMNVGN